MHEFERYIKNIYEKEGKEGVLMEYEAIILEAISCEKILSGGTPMIIKGYYKAWHIVCEKKLRIIKIFALQHGFEIK